MQIRGPERTPRQTYDGKSSFPYLSCASRAVGGPNQQVASKATGPVLLAPLFAPLLFGAERAVTSGALLLLALLTPVRVTFAREFAPLVAPVATIGAGMAMPPFAAPVAAVKVTAGFVTFALPAEVAPGFALFTATWLFAFWAAVRAAGLLETVTSIVLPVLTAMVVIAVLAVAVLFAFVGVAAKAQVAVNTTRRAATHVASRRVVARLSIRVS